MKSPKKDFASINQNTWWKRKNFTSLPENIQFDKFHVYSAKKNSFKQIEIAPLKSLIIKKKLKQTGYMVLDVTDCDIQIVENNHIGHGIQLERDSFQFQFFGTKILDWFDNLKKYCFQKDFESKYELLRILNRGSSYKVYQANNIFEQQNYSAKVYEKSLLIKDSDILAVRKEISIFRIMEHSGVVNLIEVFNDEQAYVLIYDWHEGGSLSDLIKQYHLSESQSIKILYRLIEAINYIHEHNVLHRNLKPENILLQNIMLPTDIKITDFSLADYFRKDVKYLFTRCGTPGYVAPEILHDKCYDFKVDVYSLGVLFYMMLSGGISPFPTKDYDERIYLNYQGQIDFSIIDASPDSIDLLRKLLEFNPQKRIGALQAKWHPAFKGLHKMKIINLDSEKRNSSIRLTVKQSLPPKVVESLKMITNPIIQLPPSSTKYQRRQKFRITQKQSTRNTFSNATSPLVSPGRSIFTLQSSKNLCSC